MTVNVSDEMFRWTRERMDAQDATIALLRDVLREAREDLIDLHADWGIVARIDAALDTASQPTDVSKQE